MRFLRNSYTKARKFTSSGGVHRNRKKRTAWLLERFQFLDPYIATRPTASTLIEAVSISFSKAIAMFCNTSCHGTSTFYIYMHTCIHVYMYMHTCIHAYMHTCTHAHMHTCTHAYMHTCQLMANVTVVNIDNKYSVSLAYIIQFSGVARCLYINNLFYIFSINVTNWIILMRYCVFLCAILPI